MDNFYPLQGDELVMQDMSIIHTYHSSLGPTQPPIQWAAGTLCLKVKYMGHEADHSLPSSAEVKNAWSYVSTPLISLNGMVLS